MEVISAIETLRAQVKAWHQAGQTVAFVPTIGQSARWSFRPGGARPRAG
ncbi:MAG: hypothetical protein R3E89_06950 [Thiolinea sp.]